MTLQGVLNDVKHDKGGEAATVDAYATEDTPGGVTVGEERRAQSILVFRSPRPRRCLANRTGFVMIGT